MMSVIFNTNRGFKGVFDANVACVNVFVKYGTMHFFIDRLLVGCAVSLSYGYRRQRQALNG